MALHLVAGVEHGGQRVGVAHLHLVGDQLLVGLVVAVGLLQGDAERDRLDRLAHRRHGDAVVGRVVLDGLDVGVAGDELEGQAADADDGLHVAVGLAPQQQHVGDAAGDDVQAAREQRVVVGAAAHQRHPAGLEIGHARVLGVLLDELVMLHQDHRREQQPRLLADLELAHLGAGRAWRAREGDCDEQART